jgi:hypothetical protein
MHGTAARPARTPRFPPEYTCTSTFFKHPGSVTTGKEPRGSASPMAPRKAGYRLVVFGGIQHGALSLIEPVLVPCYCAGRWASPNSPTPFTVSWKRRKASTGERVQPKNAGYWGSAVAHTERVEICSFGGGSAADDLGSGDDGPKCRSQPLHPRSPHSFLHAPLPGHHPVGDRIPLLFLVFWTLVPSGLVFCSVTDGVAIGGGKTGGQIHSPPFGVGMEYLFEDNYVLDSLGLLSGIISFWWIYPRGF